MNLKREVLEAALVLFARQGYEGTSIRQIADAVGVTNPALYAHFEGKRAIYAELMEQGGPPVARSVIAALEADQAGPSEFVTAAVRTVWQAWDTVAQRRFLSVALREGLAGGSSEAPQITAAVAELQDQLGPTLEDWMDEGAARRQPVDGRHLAFELFGMVALIRILHLNEASTPAQREYGRQLVEQHLAFFLDAVFRDEDPQQQGPERIRT